MNRKAAIVTDTESETLRDSPMTSHDEMCVSNRDLYISHLVEVSLLHCAVIFDVNIIPSSPENEHKF